MAIPQATNSNKLCPLLRLSPGLRNAIWTHAVVKDDKPFNLQWGPLRYLEWRRLLQVCRQIRAEASPISYSMNHFVFPVYDAGESWHR